METFILDLPKNTRVASFELMNGHYITFEEYLEMDVEGAYLEWVDGKVIGFMANNLQHQEIGSFLEMLMRLHAALNDLGRVVRGNFAMKLEPQRRGREPDIFFISSRNVHLLKETYLDGAADIAIEIVSPESIERDYETKFGEYEKAKIKEYWLIDPEQKQVEFYRLNESGFYQLVETTDGVYRSEILPGFFLRVEWLWQEQPPTLAALKELNLIEQEEKNKNAG